MPIRCTQTLVLFAFLACIASQISANVHQQEAFDVANLTVRQAEIQQCLPVQRLSALKTGIEENESPIMRQVFAWLFPFGPAWNSGLWRTPYSLAKSHWVSSAWDILYQLVCCSCLTLYINQVIQPCLAVGFLTLFLLLFPRKSKETL